MTKKKIRPLQDEDYAVLSAVSESFEKARFIAARLDGTSVEEAVESGRSVAISDSLRRLRNHGLIDRDYGLDSRCLYAINERGRDAVGRCSFSRLLAQTP